MKKPSTPAQRQFIKIAQRQIGIDDDTYRDMLLDYFNVSSSTQLSRTQAGILINMLKKRGFRPVYPGGKQRRTSKQPYRRNTKAAASSARPGNITTLASPDEHRKIKALAGLVKWRYENGLQLWMLARLGINKVRTGDDAYRVIEGLKKMFENGMKKEHGAEWWMISFDDPEIMTYIDEHCPKRYRL